MIQSARNITLKQTKSNLPNMSDTITGWFQDLTFDYIERVQSGADFTESTVKKVQTRGVVQPPTPEILNILPEGCYSWEVLLVHTLPTFNIPNNQYIFYNDVKYKIMKQSDYSAYGFRSYILVEAFRADSL